MLCLHLLQNYLGLIDTLMHVLTDADRRGLTSIFHSNMRPNGEIQLRTDRRVELTGLPGAGH